MQKEIENIALNIIINFADNHKGIEKNHFYLKTSIVYEMQIKSLYICGAVDKKFNEGTFIAMVNPSIKLLPLIRPDRGYSSGILKEFAAGECDLLIRRVVVMGSTRTLNNLCTYKSRKHRPVDDINLRWPVL